MLENIRIGQSAAKLRIGEGSTTTVHAGTPKRVGVVGLRVAEQDIVCSFVKAKGVRFVRRFGAATQAEHQIF